MHKETGEIKLAKNVPEKERSNYLDISDMFKKGRILQVEDTYWEIRRANIKANRQGHITLKLKFRGGK